MLQALDSQAVQPCEPIETKKFRERRLASFGDISITVDSIYQRLCNSPNSSDHGLWLGRLTEVSEWIASDRLYAGNVFLRCLKPLIQTSTSDLAFFEQVPCLCYAASLEELKDYAELLAQVSRSEMRCAARIEELPDRGHYPQSARISQAHRESFDDLELRIHKVIKDYGFSFDIEKFDNWDDCIVESSFWHTLIRKESKRRVEQVLRELGRVKKNIGCYVSDFTVRRYQEQRKRSLANLSLMEAVNDLGETFSLEELVKSGNANPAVQRVELMVRFRGMEEWVEQDSEEWTAISATVTAPSKYHLFSQGMINTKYNGTTPSEVRDYLQSGWESARKRLHEKGIKYFGGRIAEPHHDGCPHWHMLLFVRKHEESILIDHLRAMAFRDEPNEPGAFKHRFEVEKIDPEKGSAVGYVAKYIAKNIDGFGLELDEESGNEASESAKRVKAWASTWGIRQFQMIGGPEVGTWRELRRLSKADIQKMSSEIREVIEFAHAAADEGNWCNFITAMGGALCKRSERPVRVGRLPVMNQEESREIMAVRGVKLPFLDHFVLTRLREWVIKKKKSIFQDVDTRVRNEVEAHYGVPILNGAFFGGRSPPLDLCK